MRLATKTLMIGTALALIAGCAKKPPAQLPPPPAATTDGNAGTTMPPGGVGTGDVPGSRADFLAQAGTDTILFGTDLYDVDAESQAILLRQASWLKRYPSVSATIEGHCDERGTREYNLALGDRRANAAKTFLVNQGISAARLSTISYGKERPAAAGSDEASWAQNRRAVTVLPQ